MTGISELLHVPTLNVPLWGRPRNLGRRIWDSKGETAGRTERTSAWGGLTNGLRMEVRA